MVTEKVHCSSVEGAQVRRYTRSLLVDIHATPIRQASLAAETNYVFQYPFASTPCFLLRLPEPVAPVPALPAATVTGGSVALGL